MSVGAKRLLPRCGNAIFVGVRVWYDNSIQKGKESGCLPAKREKASGFHILCVGSLNRGHKEA